MRMRHGSLVNAGQSLGIVLAVLAVLAAHTPGWHIWEFAMGSWLHGFQGRHAGAHTLVLTIEHTY
jgi:hypothetical protein